jgi:hypothetical protein
MWVRKSEEQAARERDRAWRSFRDPAILAGFCFFGLLVSFARAPRFPGMHGPHLWSEILGFSTLGAAMAAIIAYVLQVVCQKSLTSILTPKYFVMCDTCHRVKRRDREWKCECGGTFEDFDNWTWIEGDEEEEDV